MSQFFKLNSRHRPQCFINNLCSVRKTFCEQPTWDKFCIGKFTYLEPVKKVLYFQLNQPTRCSNFSSLLLVV